MEVESAPRVTVVTCHSFRLILESSYAHCGHPQTHPSRRVRRDCCGRLSNLATTQAVRKQARTTFEDRLTEQYRKIMEDIPTDIWLGSELKALADGQRERCRDAIYRYIDLSNEEAFLYNNKRITKDSWIEWRKGIETNMKLPAFKEVWAEVKKKSPANFEELRTLEE